MSVFFRVDECVRVVGLFEPVRVTCTNSREVVFSCVMFGAFVERVAECRIEMGVFDAVKSISVLRELVVERVLCWIEWVGCGDKHVFCFVLAQVSKRVYFVRLLLGDVVDKDMFAFNGFFKAGDEEDALLFRVVREFFCMNDFVVARDADNVEVLCGHVVYELACIVRDECVVVRVFVAVEVEVCFEHGVLP